MKYKPIYQIASWIIVITMILGNTIDTRAANSEPQTINPTIYWGAIVNGLAPTPANLQGAFATFEQRSGKNMSIIHWGQPWKMSDGSWGEFQTSYFNNVRNHGSIPMINWASQRLGGGVNQAEFQLRDIYNGNYDPYIRRWATDAKNWGHPFFLRFNHEMNGWWFPWGEGKLTNGSIVNGNSAGDFVRAWRHVHGIFESVGANNVTWVWAPNHVGDSSNYAPLSRLYPGGAYVDWTGFTVYNKYPTWAGLNPLLTGSQGMTWFKNSYNMLLNIAPSKPMLLAEFASVEAGDGGVKKAAWITDALTVQIPTNFPKIKAVLYMNWDINVGRTYPIETSQLATNAWAAAIGLGRYANNRYRNLQSSPIPIPGSVPAWQLSNSADSASEDAATLDGLSVDLPATTASSPTAPVAAPQASPTTETMTPQVTPVTTSTTIMAAADTFIDQTDPTSTAGGASATLQVNSSPSQSSFLKFDLSSLAGKTILNATLKFKTTSDPNAGSVDGSSVMLVSDMLWKEQHMSFDNTVSVTGTLLGTVPANTTSDTWYEVPLDAATVQQNAGGALSLAIQSLSADALLFYSREAIEPPQLLLTYQ